MLRNYAYVYLAVAIFDILICFGIEQNVKVKADLRKVKLSKPQTAKSSNLVKTVLCRPNMAGVTCYQAGSASQQPIGLGETVSLFLNFFLHNK